MPEKCRLPATKQPTGCGKPRSVNSTTAAAVAKTPHAARAPSRNSDSLGGLSTTGCRSQGKRTADCDLRLSIRTPGVLGSAVAGKTVPPRPIILRHAGFYFAGPPVGKANVGESVLPPLARFCRRPAASDQSSLISRSETGPVISTSRAEAPGPYLARISFISAGLEGAFFLPVRIRASSAGLEGRGS
jgi:hypothetical protein